MRIGTSMEAPLSEHGMGNADQRRAQVLSMLKEVGLDSRSTTATRRNVREDSYSAS